MPTKLRPLAVPLAVPQCEIFSQIISTKRKLFAPHRGIQSSVAS